MLIEFAAAPPGCGEADKRAFLVSKYESGVTFRLLCNTSGFTTFISHLSCRLVCASL